MQRVVKIYLKLIKISMYSYLKKGNIYLSISKSFHLTNCYLNNTHNFKIQIRDMYKREKYFYKFFLLINLNCIFERNFGDIELLTVWSIHDSLNYNFWTIFEIVDTIFFSIGQRLIWQRNFHSIYMKQVFGWGNDFIEYNQD